MEEKKGLICPKKNELTKAEKDLLDMITSKFYSLNQIVLAKECSPQAVYKLLRSIKKKGYLNIGLQKGLQNEGTPIKPSRNQVRLHGQEFNIKILWQDNRYQKEFSKSNIRFIEGHTIKLYRNSIEVYAGEGVSFLADNEEKADKKSMDYWTRFFIRLEHELKVIIIKENSSNIKEVNHHFERGNSEICQNAKDRKEIIRIYAVEDGKLAYWTDSSFFGDNDETGHPETAKQDRKAIDKQINDWRVNNPPTITELYQNLTKASEIVLNNQHLLSGLPEVIADLKKQIRSHLSLIKEYRKENRYWRKSMEIKYKSQDKKQKTLGEF